MTDLQKATEWGYEPDSDEKLFALAAHLMAFVFPVLGPLVIYFIKKDSSKFVAYHAAQAGIFQLIAYILGTVTCGLGLIVVLAGILWAIKANNGEWQGYPLIETVGK